MSNQLTPEERDFFTLVGRAGFINPFSHERDTLESRISGLPQNASRKKRTNAFVRAVSSRIAELERGNRATLKAFSGRTKL